METLHFFSVRRVYIISVLLGWLFGCSKEDITQFTQLSSEETGITFTNHFEEDEEFNILSYEYSYNGGGVAVGDFNNDGLQDLYFTGNRLPNALYINKGNLRFEDITVKAGVAGRPHWKTGATVADVNGDGLLDIYLCYSGPGTNEQRTNELFINNGGDPPVFTERAMEFGLDAQGTFSTQASFLDADLDGDLDMFLLNHSKITYSPFFNTKVLRSKRHPQYGNRLYKNENGFFYDVSEESGIHGSGINFGLGVSISDVNNDGWPDIYVTNDYEEQDYFYLNLHDGTFKECLKQSFRHISRFGMGSDIADYNNDGLADVFVVDMLPEDNYRQKLLKGPDEYDKYTLLRDSGYHHQNMRNMLQLNMGAATDGNYAFSEIGQLAGISSTDWSWCPLLVDLDNDGWKDLFITNGYLHDFTNMDFLKYAFGDERENSRDFGKALDTMVLIKSIPSTKLENYCFQNRHNLTFRDVSSAWGFAEKCVTNGAVYVDLDNDGDQDIVTNNINDPVSVFRNNSEKIQGNHFLKIRFKGPTNNTSAIGAKVVIRCGDEQQVMELFPTRGFQSSVAHELTFGLGKTNSVDKVMVYWPDQKRTDIENLRADTLIVLDYDQAKPASSGSPKIMNRLFEEVSEQINVSFKHTENQYIDFKVQYLLPYQLSAYGPCLAGADINGDGIEDFYVGGSRGQSGQLFLGSESVFSLSKSQPWSEDTECEDTGALFFDADRDNDLDLYVVSGSAEFLPDENRLLQDRLYLNDGKGVFTKSKDMLPKEKSNGSFVISDDYDHDGDQDLFVGGRTLPGYYPLPAYSHLLRNDSKDGHTKFTDITPEFLLKEYILTTGTWADCNNDGWNDLILAGEFAPIMIVKNDNGILKMDTTTNLNNTFGVWSKIVAGDIDNDGDIDLVAGNIGLNTQMKASIQKPMVIQYADFNHDGKIDPILSFSIKDKMSVYPSRDEMLEQLPDLKKKFIKYADYANAEIDNIINPQQLKHAKTIKAQWLQSCLFRNTGNGKFETVPLPIEAQFSKVSGLLIDDFNRDGVMDILLAGNFYPYRVEFGRNDAGYGLLLAGATSGNFIPQFFGHTGFYADGDVRSMIKINIKEGSLIVCGTNNDYLKLFKVLTK